MQDAPYDVAARKRTVSLTLNSDLYAKVRSAGMNASRIAEAALVQALKAREAEVLRVEIRQDMKALADYIAEHGDPAAELRAMFDPSDAT
jgi:post-segregation antitoxin (ccd killing protein)